MGSGDPSRLGALVKLDPFAGCWVSWGGPARQIILWVLWGSLAGCGNVMCVFNTERLVYTSWYQPCSLIRMIFNDLSTSSGFMLQNAVC